MRVLAFVVVLCVVLAGRPALAQETEALRSEIDTLRKQLQSLATTSKSAQA